MGGHGDPHSMSQLKTLAEDPERAMEASWNGSRFDSGIASLGFNDGFPVESNKAVVTSRERPASRIRSWWHGNQIRFDQGR
jgi:hypothetical protein